MNLIKTLPTDQSFDQIIYIGAGELQPEDIINLKVKKLTLVEAHPDLYSELLENFKHWPKSSSITLNVLNDSVDNNETTKVFNLLNLPEMSGFNLPSGLIELYPGLKVLESEKVQTTSLVALLSALNLDQSDDQNLLMIDIPTQVDELLSTFLESEYAKKIDAIKFTKSSSPLSDKDITLKHCLSNLGSRGFELHSKMNEQEDFIFYSVIKNQLFEELSAVKLAHENTVMQQLNELKCLAEKNDSKSVQLKIQIEEKEKLSEANNILQEKLLATEHELKVVQSESSNQLQELSKSSHTVQVCNQRIEELQKSEQGYIQNAQELEKQLQQLKQEIEKLSRLNQSLTSQLEKTQQEAGDRQSFLDVLNEEKQALQQEFDLLNANLAESKHALSTEQSVHATTRESEIKHKDWAHNLKGKLEALEAEHQKLVQASAQAQDSINEQLNEKAQGLGEAIAQKTKVESQLNSVIEQSKALQTQLDETTKQLEEKSKWLAEHEKWNAGLKSENAALVDKVATIEKNQEDLIKQIDAKEKESANKAQKLQEQQYRNERLEQEVVKLEAQLELIKDVILREKAF